LRSYLSGNRKRSITGVAITSTTHGIMGRHVFYTKITPLPSNVPRLLALDLLHSHDEFIRLNPLVTDVKPIEAPRDAEGDEFFSNWYRIYEKTKTAGIPIKIDFKGCFHNQSWGMQSHMLGPAGIEMRNKYRIGGNQPGEPREDRELGVNTPQDGLYLREDISFTCNAIIASTVKKGMQEASQVMIDRMARKAELLDEGKIHAMFENGKLKTSKPTGALLSADNANGDRASSQPSPGLSAPGSPGPFGDRDSPVGQQPEFKMPGYTNYGSLVGRHTSHSQRTSSYVPMYQQPGYNGPDQRQSTSDGGSVYQQQPNPQYLGQYDQKQQGYWVNELPGNMYQPQQPNGLPPQGQSFRSELPGDITLYPDATQNRDSVATSSTTPSQGYQSAQPSPNVNSNQIYNNGQFHPRTLSSQFVTANGSGNDSTAYPISESPEPPPVPPRGGVPYNAYIPSMQQQQQQQMQQIGSVAQRTSSSQGYVVTDQQRDYSPSSGRMMNDAYYYNARLAQQGGNGQSTNLVQSGSETPIAMPSPTRAVHPAYRSAKPNFSRKPSSPAITAAVEEARGRVSKCPV